MFRAHITTVLAGCLAALALRPCSLVAAQAHDAAIIGQIVDHQTREPVGGARIGLLGIGQELASDSTGRFTHAGLKSGAYVLQVRAIGYSAASWIVEVGDGEVHSEVFELQRLPYVLDPLVVERWPSFSEERRAEFQRRRAAGRGYFVTEEESLERHQPRHADHRHHRHRNLPHPVRDTAAIPSRRQPMRHRCHLDPVRPAVISALGASAA